MELLSLLEKSRCSEMRDLVNSIPTTGMPSRVLGRLDGGAAWPQSYSFRLVRSCRVRVRVGTVRVGFGKGCGNRVDRVRGGLEKGWG